MSGAVDRQRLIQGSLKVLASAQAGWEVGFRYLRLLDN